MGQLQSIPLSDVNPRDESPSQEAVVSEVTTAMSESLDHSLDEMVARGLRPQKHRERFVNFDFR